jgi:hypothetical protein
MKKYYREELNEDQKREDDQQVERDFRDFIKIGLPTIIGLILILILVFTLILIN